MNLREPWSNFLRGRSTYASPPIFAKVEITRKCNLECDVCLRRSLPKLPDMRAVDFHKILSFLPSSVKTVAIHGYGEPMMHPHFNEIIALLGHYKKSLYLSTNGLLLTPELSLDILKNHKVFKLSFSIDDYHLKGGADLKRLKRNIICAIRNRYYSNPCAKIVIHSTIGMDTMKSVPKMLDFAEETQVDGISFNDITIYNYGTATKENAIRESYGGTSLAQLTRMLSLNSLFRVDASFHLDYEDSCKWPWRNIYIDIKGDVYPCTDTLNHPLGNVFNESVREIWNGRPMRDFRKKWISNSVGNCRKCISRRAV